MSAPGFTMLSNAGVIDRLPEIDGTALKVYLALARRTGQAGRCWPSQPTIATDTGLRPRAVRNALSRLRALGLVRTEAQSGRSTVYCLTPAPPCRPENGGPAPPCRTPRHRRAAHPGTAVPTEQEKENKTKRTRPRARGRAAARVKLPKELDSEIFRVAWERWLEYRRERRLTLTAATLEGQLKKLTRLGPAEAAAEIENSIGHGWHSLCYKPTTDGGGKHNRVGPGQKYDPSTAGLPVKGGF